MKKVWCRHCMTVSVALWAVVLMGTSRCQTLPIDRAMAAQKGNAATVVLCTDGICTRGFTFIQINDTAAATKPIMLKMRKDYRCGRDACVKFQIFNPDGSEGFNGSIPDGQDTAAFTLGDVIQSPVVYPLHDSEWLMKVVVWFKDNDGEIRKKYGHSYIRVNVTAADYSRLACGDPETAWKVKLQKDCEAHYSTGFRSAECGKCRTEILGQ